MHPCSESEKAQRERYLTDPTYRAVVDQLAIELHGQHCSDDCTRPVTGNWTRYAMGKIAQREDEQWNS